MLWLKENSYKEFDNEKHRRTGNFLPGGGGKPFTQNPAARKLPPPPPITFLMVHALATMTARATKTFLVIEMNACLISTLLKWQILVNFPTEYWGPHPSSDSEKKLNLFLCLRPPNNVTKGNLTSCWYKL